MLTLYIDILTASPLTDEREGGMFDKVMPIVRHFWLTCAYCIWTQWKWVI